MGEEPQFFVSGRWSGTKAGRNGLCRDDYLFGPFLHILPPDLSGVTLVENALYVLFADVKIDLSATN